jgi:hypothetical protein
MKYLPIAALIANASAEQVFGAVEMAETFQGMLEAYGSKIDIVQLLECGLFEATSAFKAKQALKSLYFAWEYGDPISLVQGILEAITSYETGVAGAKHCSKIEPSQEFYNSFQTLIDLEFDVLFKNLMANYEPIMQEIGAIQNAYNEGAWEDVG